MCIYVNLSLKHTVLGQFTLDLTLKKIVERKTDMLIMCTYSFSILSAIILAMDRELVAPGDGAFRQ